MIRHAEPFSKTDRGRERREERKFVERNRFALVDEDFLLIQEDKLRIMEEMRWDGWPRPRSR